MRPLQTNSLDAFIVSGLHRFSPLHMRVKPRAPFTRSEGYRLSELDLIAQICSLPLHSPALPRCENSMVHIFSSARSDSSCALSRACTSSSFSLEYFLKYQRSRPLLPLASLKLGSRLRSWDAPPPKLWDCEPLKGFPNFCTPCRVSAYKGVISSNIRLETKSSHAHSLSFNCSNL
jgi:hypothetical protein